MAQRRDTPRLLAREQKIITSKHGVCDKHTFHFCIQQTRYIQIEEGLNTRKYDREFETYSYLPLVAPHHYKDVQVG